MVPKMNEVFNRTDVFWIGRANTLNDFPNISQVKSVMGLGWGWQELSFDKLEYFKTIFADRLCQTLCRFRESSEVKIQQ